MATATAALRFTRLPDPAPGLRAYSVQLGAQDIGTVTNRRGDWWRATTPAGHGRGSFHHTRKSAAAALCSTDPTPDTKETSDMPTTTTACCDAFSATAGELHDDPCENSPATKLAETSTPDLVREYASIRVQGALGNGGADSHARLGVVVTELRRRGVLDNR